MNRPLIRTAMRLGPSLRFDFQSLAGARYAIEGSTPISSGQWQQIQEVSGTGDLQQITVPTSGSAAGFYRIRLEPQ